MIKSGGCGTPDFLTYIECKRGPDRVSVGQREWSKIHGPVWVFYYPDPFSSKAFSFDSYESFDAWLKNPCGKPQSNNLFDLAFRREYGNMPAHREKEIDVHAGVAHLKEWIEAECVIGKDAGDTPSQKLYRAYRHWALRLNQLPMGTRAFKKSMDALKIRWSHRRTANFFTGIHLARAAT